MGLFDQLGQRIPQQPQRMDPRQAQQQMQRELGEIKAHPGSYLKNLGYTVPDGMTDADHGASSQNGADRHAEASAGCIHAWRRQTVK